MTTLSTRSHCITAATAVELSIRDSTILMLWTAQARAQPSPRHNCHHHYITLPYTLYYPLNFYLVQLSLCSLPQVGVHCPPKGLDQRLWIHCKDSVWARIWIFQRTLNSHSLRTWTHSSPVTRRERKQWMEYPDRSAPDLCNTNIRLQQMQHGSCSSWDLLLTRQLAILLTGFRLPGKNCKRRTTL